MTIWRTILGAAAFAAAVATSSHAEPATLAPLDPARVAAARAYIDVALPASGREAMMNGIIGGMLRNMTTGILQNEDLKAQFAQHPALRGVFDRFADRQRDLAITDLRESMPQLLTAQADAYARIYSVDELHELTAFFRQPLGQKYIANVPKMFADPEVAAWQQGVAARALQRMPGELARLKAQMKAVVDSSGAK